MSGILDASWRSRWHLLVAIAATVASIIIPFLVVFEDRLSPIVLSSEILLTILFGVDLLINIRDRRERRTLWVLADLAAVLPLHGMTGIAWLQIFRLTKLVSVARLMRIWRRSSAQSLAILRISFFLYWLLLSIHWLSIGWLAIHGHAGHENRWSEYLRSSYWCIQTLSTVGYGDILPESDIEFAYAIVVMVFGVAVFGYIVGTVASMLANIDPAKAHYQETMEKVTAFMRYHHLPQSLQRRISEYFQYLWDQHRGYDDASVFSCLPPPLLTEVSLYMKKDIIEKVPFFRTASEQLIRAIAMQMQPVTYMPGDYVFRAGDQGREMYFISKGTLDVISQDNRTVLTTLTDGDFFGEIALVQSRPRTASVRAVNFCDLYTLEKSSLGNILETDREFAARVHESIRTRLERGT